MGGRKSSDSHALEHCTRAPVNELATDAHGVRADLTALFECRVDALVYHDDCVAGMRTLPDLSVDVIITDPPYSQHTHTKQRAGQSLPDGRGRHPRKGARVGSACLARERDLGFEAITDRLIVDCSEAFARLARRWVLVFCDDKSAAVWGYALERAGLEWVRTGIWVKPGAAPQFNGDRPAQGHEEIVIAHRPGMKRWNGGGRHAVWRCPIVLDRGHRGGVRLHTTQKPLPLMESLVRDFTEPGELVIDAFAGSGTTGVAALRNGRRFIGFEQDEKYFEVALARLAETKFQPSLFDDGPTKREQLELLDK